MLSLLPFQPGIYISGFIYQTAKSKFFHTITIAFTMTNVRSLIVSLLI